MLLHKEFHSIMVYFVQSFLAFHWSVNWPAEGSKPMILAEQRFHGLHFALCTLHFVSSSLSLSCNSPVRNSTFRYAFHHFYRSRYFWQTVDRLIMAILRSPLPFLPVLILHETACRESLIHILQTLAPKLEAWTTRVSSFTIIVSSWNRHNLLQLIPFQKLSTCVVVLKALWWILSSTCLHRKFPHIISIKKFQDSIFSRRSFPHGSS